MLRLVDQDSCVGRCARHARARLAFAGNNEWATPGSRHGSGAAGPDLRARWAGLSLGMASETQMHPSMLTPSAVLSPCTIGTFSASSQAFRSTAPAQP